MKTTQTTRKILFLLASIAVSWHAQAQNTSGAAALLSNVAQLSADGSVDVQQDLLRITLRTTKQGADAQEVQNQLKQAVDSALQTAKGQAQAGLMDVHTGQFSLYPSRNSNNRIAGWQGSADVVLSGTDIPRISSVAGKIQSLTISDVAFDISPDLRRKTETEAQTKAIAAFRKKAEEITHDFGFRSYSLREASVQADHVYGGSMPRMRMVEAKAYSNDATPLPTEPGKSTVRVVVQGSVQMQ